MYHRRLRLLCPVQLQLGNVFNYPVAEDFEKESAALRRMHQGRGVTMTIPKVVGGKALVYTYRAEELEFAIQDKGVWRLLRSCGYARFDVSGVLRTFRSA